MDSQDNIISFKKKIIPGDLDFLIGELQKEKATDVMCVFKGPDGGIRYIHSEMEHRDFVYMARIMDAIASNDILAGFQNG